MRVIVNSTISRMCVLFITLSMHPAHADFQARSDYRQAVTALKNGQVTTFKRLQTQLSDYVLSDYLDYHWIRHQLRTKKITAAQFNEFYTHNADMPAAPLLKRRWLISLGRNRAWHTLRSNYSETTNTELYCYYLRSLYGTGDKEAALKAVTDVWVEPKSQPKSCDPLFDAWRKSAHFKPEHAWQRIDAAIGKRELGLARYASRYLAEKDKSAAEAYIAVHQKPARIANTRNYKANTAKGRQIITHGLKRLARKDPAAAQRAWRTYKSRGEFSPTQSRQISDEITTYAAKRDATFPAIKARAQHTSDRVRTNLSTSAIVHQNWSEAVYWIEQLDPSERSKPMWEYWLAHALTETMGPSERATLILQSLATQRHYYGFLAAKKLGISGVLNQQHSAVDGNQIMQIRNHPTIQRSVELFAVGDDLNGRREWYAALDQFSAEQQVAAAHLASELGLTTLSITTANVANANNHLELRFPVVHEQQFRQATLTTGLPTPQLLATARQESALNNTARSHANARGLMQLLPSTATLVARRAGTSKPSTADLYDPSTNIKLGSYHLAWLYERYSQKSPLAIAAYNAGEHRVDRWIKDLEATPMDIWIESIPFRETRNYVKNVLAFRYVYGKLLDSPQPLLAAHEQTVN